MIIEKLDHIAIAVSDIEKTVSFYETLIGVKSELSIVVSDQGIISKYLPLPNLGIEFIQPLEPDGGIQKFIDKKGEGLHHIALKIRNLDNVITELTEAEIKLIIGTAGDKKAVFIHPKSTGGVLIELCE